MSEHNGKPKKDEPFVVPPKDPRDQDHYDGKEGKHSNGKKK